ncbi:PH domain-containing protein [Aquimarina sp. RZ0]|uniref:PH domain-containing protein n=1 Tax=Aquimarina sp. RZ0 TaxID=2607730 RepID=UPI0011F1AEF0|nr:PH domain-containing protein [Aquimarina sp. RZ0]KAA1243041.1 PH domain-containing protein [Aquimarina sp. RZ0]
MEKEIWKGHPSHWVSFSFYLLCIPLILVFGLGLLLALWRYFYTRSNIFTITDQRIIEEKGILSKITDEIELYRVKDIQFKQPFLLRLVGLSTIVLDTTDKSNPILIIKGVPQGKELKEKLRAVIDNRRDLKKVRELDI